MDSSQVGKKAGGRFKKLQRDVVNEKRETEKVVGERRKNERMAADEEEIF